MAEQGSHHRVPQSVEDLSALGQSAQQENIPRLGRRAMAALIWMLENPHRAAVCSITEIAVEAGVDPSTLTRLGKRLGLAGFTDLQEVFRKHIAQRGLFYSNHAKGIMDRRSSGRANRFQQLAHEEVERILATASGTDDASIEKASELICNANNVYVIGVRATYSVAYFFGAFASFLRPRVAMLGISGGAIAEELAQVSRDDVFVVVSFRPYTKVAVEACAAMAKRNVPIVAITDASSPLAGEGESRVTLRTQGPFYFNSAVSSFLLVELLLSSVAEMLGPRAIAHMHEVEALLAETSIETD